MLEIEKRCVRGVANVTRSLSMAFHQQLEVAFRRDVARPGFVLALIVIAFVHPWRMQARPQTQAGPEER